MANLGPIIGGGIALLLLSRLLGGSSRDDRTHDQPVTDGSLIWPIEEKLIKRYGESVLEHRKSTGKPHKGLDIFADARTVVRAVQAGKVLRVIDGRKSEKESSKAAGLWIDIEAIDGIVYRYLHLGDYYVATGQKVSRGAPLGYIAEPNTSGLGDTPHLHFEIRNGDYTKLRDDYGMPIDPLTKLPPLRRAA